ncbi:beta-N-acetylglucosaminidase domain-containing protein [Clostridium nigeriense]|uniref:beta-N-acetylglucosaminidase domain-containing protein n=1 Tax=Clostridium nigeriense TaxID=1805470 RepID=UPI003D34B0AC
MGGKLKKKILNIIATTCAITIIMSTLSTTVTNAEDSTEWEAPGVKADIYPVPQNINYLSDGGMKLEGEVNVVIRGEQEEATITKLKEILEKNNIDYSISDEALDGVANIIVSSDKNNYESYGVLDENQVLSEKEAYILKASDDENIKGNISIVGSDEDGAYYGVLTLGQILEQSTSEGRFAEVNISDYPEIEFRGFIEGFYGEPWSHEERLGLMEDTSKFKMNTYIYAPKDDPYHRQSWKELYPEDEASQIAELAKVGKDNNFNFCWTVHPGATLKFTDEDYQALINKFEQLYSLGVRQFGVLFDDTDDWTNGKKQAEWINKIDTEFIKAKGDISPMIVVSARYNSAWGPNMNVYFKPFMETLNNDIQVMWTGHATMSNVSKEVFEWPKIRTGVNKDLAVWWNYPVNDYCDSRILMAPLHNLNQDLDNVSGFFSNPMNQAEASKVALYSIADYTWNTDTFDYMKSWESSIENLVPEVKEEFMRFASNTSYLKDDGGASGTFEYDESWYLTEKIDTLKSAIENNENIKQSAQVLLDEFNTMVSDYESIVSKVANDNLLDELEPFLNAYKALGEAGVASMEALIAAENGDIENWLNYNSVAQENLDLMNTFKVKRVKDGAIKEYVVSVGSKRLKPLVQESIRDSKAVISKSFLVNYEPKVISSIADVLSNTVEASGGNYSLKGINNIKLDKGDYIGIALPKAMKLREVKFNADKYEGITIEYSLNGIEWKSLETAIEDNSLKSNSVIEATFIRALNSLDKAITLNIENLQVNPVYKANPTISQNIGIYQDYVIENALDGNLETKYWSDKATGKGNYIQLDLGKNIPVYDINAYFNGQDYMRNSEFMISADGSSWTSLGELKYTDKDGKKLASVNGEGKMARYIKIQANGENDGFWVQLCEFQINKTVAEIDDDSVSLVEGTPKGNFAYLYDGDLSTAFQSETVNDGDAFVYKMSRITNIKELLFLQDNNNISNAVISVKDLEGNWIEIGRLDKQFNTISVNKEILEVKVTFSSSNPAPKIYEIITKEAVSEVNKDELRAVVEQAEAINLEDYTDESTAILIALIENAKTLLNDESASQEDVYKLKEDILEAIENLILKDDNIEESDKTAIAIVIEYAEEVKANGGLENVVPTVVNEFESALEEAKLILAKEDATQEEVDTVMKRLVKVIHMLDFKKGDKTQLIKLVKIIDALEKDKYKPSTWSLLEVQLNEANKVIVDENAMEEEVSKIYESLVKAYLDLRLVPNKDKLEELIIKANKIDQSKYTEDSVDKFKIALEKAIEVLSNNEVSEAEIEISTNNLKESINNLVVKGDEPKKEDPDDEKPNNEENSNGENNKEETITGENNRGENNNDSLPRTGDTIASVQLIIFGLLLVGGGIIIGRKKAKL